MTNIYCVLALFILVLHILGTVGAVLIPFVLPLGALAWWLPVFPMVLIMWVLLKGCPLSQLETELTYLGGCGKKRMETHDQYTSTELEDIARRYSGIQVNGKTASASLMAAWLATWVVFMWRSRHLLPAFSLRMPRLITH